MKRPQHVGGRLGILLCSALLGGTTYAQPSVSATVSVPLPAVEIRAESDFYQPLTPYGEWVVIGSYGRCWRPGRVEAGWRPYCNGYWESTDAGWYWASDEPWAWATYHYGRWDLSPEYGWYWVPQTQWAPAWVSWHRGGGYIGWAPLYPAARFARGGSVKVDVKVISPRAYVFVEERHFLEPVRPSMVAANNATLISHTVNITNTRLVKNTVINGGPSTAVIEKASGRKLQPVLVRDLRHQEIAGGGTAQKTPATIARKPGGTPVGSEVEPHEKKAVVARAPVQVEKPTAVKHEAAKAAPKHNQARQPVPVPTQLKPEPKAEVRPEARPETNPPEAVREPAERRANQHSEKQANPPERDNHSFTAPPPPAKPAGPPSPN